MAQGWKRAECRTCKQAETLAPVDAHTGSPRSAEARAVQERLRTVQDAVVRDPAVRPSRSSPVYPAKVAAGAEKRTQPQPVICRRAAQDITLKDLFP